MTFGDKNNLVLRGLGLRTLLFWIQFSLQMMFKSSRAVLVPLQLRRCPEGRRRTSGPREWRRRWSRQRPPEASGGCGYGDVVGCVPPRPGGSAEVETLWSWRKRTRWGSVGWTARCPQEKRPRQNTSVKNGPMHSKFKSVVIVSDIQWKFTEFQSISHHWKRSVLRSSKFPGTVNFEGSIPRLFCSIFCCQRGGRWFKTRNLT